MEFRKRLGRWRWRDFPDKLPIGTYQEISQITAAGGSSTLRDGPDVSANANFTYYVCADQEACTANEYGGTSFAAPLWAGYTALANQQAKPNGVASAGFINNSIYPLAVASQTTYFHDITTGSNGYSALVGYDLATGWGSINGAALINDLAGPATPNYSLSASPTAVSLSTAGGSRLQRQSPAPLWEGFDYPVTVSASNVPTGVTASFGTNPVTGTGTSVLTFTAGSSPAPTAGTYTITVSGLGNGITQTTTVTLIVVAPNFTISASPSPVSVGGAAP